MGNLFYQKPNDIIRVTKFQYPQWQNLWFLPEQEVLNDANQFTPNFYGLIGSNIEPIADYFWRVIESPNNKRSLKIDPLEDAAGPYFLVTISGYIPFAALDKITKFDILKYHRCVLIVVSGADTLLIGAPGDGASFKFNSDKGDNPRTVPGMGFQFTWKTKDHPFRYGGALPT